MKKLLLGVLILRSLSIFAFHVEESDEFINVGRIESINLIKTLNIKPNSYSTNLRKCELIHNKVNYDRSLTAPKVFEYISIETDKYMRAGWDRNPIGTLIIRFSGLKSASQIQCKDVYYNQITVAEVRELLKGYIEFTIPKPIEMD